MNNFEREILEVFSDKNRRAKYKDVIKKYLSRPTSVYAIYNDNNEEPIDQVTIFYLEYYGWYVFGEAQFCGGQLEKLDRNGVEILIRQKNNYDNSILTFSYLRLIANNRLYLAKSKNFNESLLRNIVSSI